MARDEPPLPVPRVEVSERELLAFAAPFRTAAKRGSWLGLWNYIDRVSVAVDPRRAEDQVGGTSTTRLKLIAMAYETWTLCAGAQQLRFDRRNAESASIYALLREGGGYDPVTNLWQLFCCFAPLSLLPIIRVPKVRPDQSTPPRLGGLRYRGE